MEWRQTERPLLRALVRELAQQAGWELVLLRTRIPASRPAVSRRLRGRMRVRTARTGAARAELLRAASIFVPAAEGLPRLVAEAQTAGVAIAAPPGRAEQPELAAAETARMIEDEAFRARRAAETLAAARVADGRGARGPGRGGLRARCLAPAQPHDAPAVRRA